MHAIKNMNNQRTTDHCDPADESKYYEPGYKCHLWYISACMNDGSVAAMEVPCLCNKHII